MLKNFTKISILCLALGMHAIGYASQDNTVIGQVTGLNNPQALVASPDGTKVYIANAGANNVEVLDVATNALIIGTGYPISVGNSPQDIAINPAGTRVYVSNNGDGTVSVINTSDNSVTSISFNDSQSYPNGIVVNNDGSKVYVALNNYNNGAGQIAVIDTSNNSVTYPPSMVLAGAYQLALSPNGQYLYATEVTNNFVHSYTTSDNAAHSTANPQGSPGQIVFAPDGLTAYVVTSSAIAIIDTTDLAAPSYTGNVTDANSLLVNPDGIAISPDGSTVYVSNSINPGSITIIDTQSNATIGDVNLSPFTLNTPVALAMVPGTSYMYSADSGNDTASQIFTFVAISAPATITGVSQANVFFTQIDYINTISWTAPTSGSTPVVYKIYRDAELTVLIGTVAADGDLLFYDHNRIVGTTYTYYVTSVDAANAQSSAISVAVTTVKNK